MDWFGFLEQVFSGEDGGTHIEYDEHGLTVVADVDGDGVVDRVSRMEYGGQSVTVDLEDWGMSAGNQPLSKAPEMGELSPRGTESSPGWGAL